MVRKAVYPVIGDFVVTMIVVQNPNGGILPPGLVGKVCGISNGLLQVDFGELGIKFLGASNVDVVGHSLTDAELGEDVNSVMVHLVNERDALREELRQNSQMFRAPARLHKSDGSRN